MIELQLLLATFAAGANRAGCVSLERAIAEYVAHYCLERSYHGQENEITSGAPVQRERAIEASDRLGGLLKYYHRVAA